MKVIYDQGQPCQHPGCLCHLTHPCEGCGRILGAGVVVELPDSKRRVTIVSSTNNKVVKVIKFN